MISTIITKLHRSFHRPIYLLDENIRGYYGLLPKCKYVLAHQVVKRGTSDEVLLEVATERNLIIITNDIRFVLYAITKNKNIIYENNEGYRFSIPGKNTKLIGKVENHSSVKRPTRQQKKIQHLADRTPLTLSLDGFYMVNSF